MVGADQTEREREINGDFDLVAEWKRKPPSIGCQRAGEMRDGDNGTVRQFAGSSPAEVIACLEIGARKGRWS